MTKNMVKESIPAGMILYTREILQMGESMDMVCTTMIMEISMMDTSVKVFVPIMVSICFIMGLFMMENGKTIIVMVLVPLLIQRAIPIRENGRTTIEKVKVTWSANKREHD